MGRIVIPRYQRQRAQLKQRPKGRGYFANGFGPQEMSLISKLTDLAVAGGGQIARAVQIGNREEEQAKAQADYDRKIQTNAEERRAAAQGLVDATDIDGQVEAFFAQQEPPSVRERLPSMSSMNLQSDLVQPRPMQRGGGVLAKPGLLAPEDVTRMEEQRGQLAGADRSMDLNAPEAYSGNPMDIALNAMNVVRNAKRMHEETSLIRPVQTARDIETMLHNAQADLRRAASLAVSTGDLQAQQVAMRGIAEMATATPFSPNYGETTQAEQLLARADQGVDMAMTPEERATAMAAMPTLPAPPPARLQFQNRFSAADEYGSMQRRAAREQEMQGRDFRQEAVSGLRDPNDPTIESVGPAPERKLFRIADILAAAPSARTAEQRAILLQAAADSPDIMAANLTDLAKGAYRDRAMQAVMKLFPEEEEPMSELDILRMQSMRESIETSNLRQQTLQAALDEDAAKAEKRANAVRKTDPKRAKKEALFAFYTKNLPRKEEIGEEAWRAGAGELWDMTPSGLPAWVRNNKLSRGTRKSVNTTVGRLLQMRPKPDPRPPRTTLTPSEEIRLENNITRLETQEADARSKVRAFEATLLNAKALKLAEKRGISKAQIEATIAGEKEKARIAKEGIKASKARLEAKPAATPAPSGAVYTAPTEGETEQEKYNRLNARLK